MKSLRELVTAGGDELNEDRVAGIVFATRGRDADMCIVTPSGAPVAVTLEALRRARVGIQAAIDKLSEREHIANGESFHVGVLSTGSEN